MYCGMGTEGADRAKYIGCVSFHPHKQSEGMKMAEGCRVGDKGVGWGGRFV